MALSDTDVANMALDLLKEGVISSFDDDRPVGRWMRRNYYPIRDMILVANPWRFAVKRDAIAEDPTPPAFGYRHSYPKPDDCLRVLPLRYMGATNGPLIRYSVESGFILTDAPAPLKMRYISRVEDSTLFSPLFVDAFTTAMALRLSTLLTGKDSVTATLRAAHKEAITLAMFTDSAEGYAEDQVADQYDTARYGNVYDYSQVV